MSAHPPPTPPLTEGILTLACADRPGIVAMISSALLRHEANIKSLNQYSDPERRQLFMRLHFELERTRADPASRLAALRQTLDQAATSLKANYRLYPADAPMKTLIL
ncbi:MAG: hypothetical protein AB7E55_13935, partial [Pigmentiphaga sp.]